MLPKITIDELKKVIGYNYNNGIKRAILALGGPGIGKSEAVYQFVAERNIKYVDLRLLLFSETDLKGLPYFTEDRLHTAWLPNDFLPNVERDGERGILLIEELTSADKRVQAAAYQLILDRKIGSYTLPEGWMIVALGNRQEDAGVWVQIPSPLANRFEIFEVICNVDTWKYSYAVPNKVNPFIISYLSAVPSDIFAFNYDDPEMNFATPRSWTAVSRILNVYRGPFNLEDSDFQIIRKKIEANIGMEITAKFVSFMLHNTDLGFIDDVLDGKHVPVPGSSDMRYLAITSLVSKLDFIRDVKDASNFGDDADSVVNALKYIMRFPPEYVVLGLKSFTALNPTVFKKFLIMNSDLAGIVEFSKQNAYLFR